MNDQLKKILEHFLKLQIVQDELINYYKDIILKSFNVDLSNISQSIDELSDKDTIELHNHKKCLTDAEMNIKNISQLIAASMAGLLNLPDEISISEVMKKINLDFEDVYDKGVLMREKTIADIKNQIN